MLAASSASSRPMPGLTLLWLIIQGFSIITLSATQIGFGLLATPETVLWWLVATVLLILTVQGTVKMLQAAQDAPRWCAWAALLNFAAQLMSIVRVLAEKTLSDATLINILAIGVFTLPLNLAWYFYFTRSPRVAAYTANAPLPVEPVRFFPMPLGQSLLFLLAACALCKSLFLVLGQIVRDGNIALFAALTWQNILFPVAIMGSLLFARSRPWLLIALMALWGVLNAAINPTLIIFGMRTDTMSVLDISMLTTVMAYPLPQAFFATILAALAWRMFGSDDAQWFSPVKSVTGVSDATAAPFSKKNVELRQRGAGGFLLLTAFNLIFVAQQSVSLLWPMLTGDGNASILPAAAAGGVLLAHVAALLALLTRPDSRKPRIASLVLAFLVVALGITVILSAYVSASASNPASSAVLLIGMLNLLPNLLTNFVACCALCCTLTDSPHADGDESFTPLAVRAFQFGCFYFMVRLCFMPVLQTVLGGLFDEDALMMYQPTLASGLDVRPGGIGGMLLAGLILPVLCLRSVNSSKKKKSDFAGFFTLWILFVLLLNIRGIIAQFVGTNLFGSLPYTLVNIQYFIMFCALFIPYFAGVARQSRIVQDPASGR